MKNLINKSLKIVAIIAMMISVSGANKDEAPVLMEGRYESIDILFRDYITIYGGFRSKQNGDCKVELEAGNNIVLGYGHTGAKFGTELNWRIPGKIYFPNNNKDCTPSLNENEKYIIVLNTNFGSYMYEYVWGNTSNADLISLDHRNEVMIYRRYVLPLIGYKK